MAAGVGNRLMPLTANIPKPMVPISNIPVMEYGVELLRLHNFTDVIANLHYLGNNISNYFGNGENFGVNLAYSREENLLGTAGGVKNNAWFLKGDTFVVLSGDALTDIDLASFINFHKAKGALATIALKRVEEVSEYGVVITDNDGRIKAFQEKPKEHEALSNLVNTGIYAFEPEIFKLIPASEFFDFGKNLFPKLVEGNLPFYGYNCEDAYWCDIGSIKMYLAANKDLLRKKIKTSVDFSAISITANIGKDVELKGQVVIGEGCIIEDGAFIKNSIIWPRSIIRKSTIILDSVIGADCKINKGFVRKSIIPDHQVLENNKYDLVEFNL